jgi:hypothetical protein
MTSVVGRKLFTVVALLARVLDYCGNFDRRGAVGRVLDFSLRWCRSGSNGPMFSCVEGPKLIVVFGNTNNLLNNVKYKKVFCLES